MSPDEILEVWIRLYDKTGHMATNEAARERFFARPELKRLAALPDHAVVRAIEHERKLIRILRAAQRMANGGSAVRVEPVRNPYDTPPVDPPSSRKYARRPPKQLAVTDMPVPDGNAPKYRRGGA